MPATVLPDEWAKFREFAQKFYMECLDIAVKVGGYENPKNIQIILEKITPEILDLFELWDSIRIEFEAPKEPLLQSTPNVVPS